MVRVAGAWDKWKTESQMEMKPILTRPVSTDWLIRSRLSFVSNF